MHIEENVILAPFTTFRIGGKARFFVEVKNMDELKSAVFYAQEKNIPIFILGGGSNVLISDEGFSGLVIKMSLKDIEWKNFGDDVFVTAGAGIVWDDLVSESVSKNLWGLENLSYIPGTVGAVPVQNIGAYGFEVKDVIESVFVFDSKSNNVIKLSNAECGFGYRDSFFKKDTNKNFVVLSVTFKLSKNSRPNLSYKDLNEYFLKKANPIPTLLQIREAVIEIRKNKLPDWHTIGTAGSFFKNPTIKKEYFNKLLLKYPEMPHFEVGGGLVKIPLAWILDKVCGLKGLRYGDVGLYEKQPLAIVNFGNAKSEEVKKLAQKIFEIVKEKTGIEIEWEVQFIESKNKN